MSKNVIELLVRRSRGEGAPTALDVLKDAVDDHGVVTDDDRRRAAAVTGMPEAAVYGVSSYYDDLTQVRGRRHVRVCTGTACWAADFDEHVDAVKHGLGLELRPGIRGRRGVAGRDRLPWVLPLAGFAVRDHDVVDAGPDAVERVLGGAAESAAEPEWQSRLDRARAAAPGGLLGAGERPSQDPG